MLFRVWRTEIDSILHWEILVPVDDVSIGDRGNIAALLAEMSGGLLTWDAAYSEVFADFSTTLR